MSSSELTSAGFQLRAAGNNHNRSSPIQTELNNIFERQLNGSGNRNSFTMGPRNPPNLYHLDDTVPGPPRPKPRRVHTTNDRLNENNRMLLKEMMERNRNSRRLSNPMAKENFGSSTAVHESLIIQNPYGSLLEGVITPASTSTAATARLQTFLLDEHLEPVVSVDLTRLTVDEIRTIPEELESERLASASSSDLIQFPSDEGIQPEPEHNRYENLDLPDPEALFLPAEEDSDNVDIQAQAQSQSPPNLTSESEIPNTYGYQRTASIAASSQSLDSFLQSSPTKIEIPSTSAQSSSSLSTSSLYYDDSPGDLRIGNKVVWFTPHGVPETGVVKWIGKIKERFHAGVEFERSIGNSSGLIAGKRVFTCALTHGRFIPVSELILNLDFYSGSCSNAPSPYSCGLPKSVSEDNDGGEKNNIYDLPIVCVICQDPLLAPEDEPEDFDEEDELELSKNNNLSKSKSDSKIMARCPIRNNKEMVTTKCGHLFHSDCLTQWFRLKPKIQQPCPYCQRMMDIKDIIRIYPVQGTS